MTTKFTVRVSIARQPHELWEFITNFDNAPTWMPGVIRVTHTDEGNLGRGSTLRHELKDRSREFTVSYWEPEKCFTLTHNTQSMSIDSSFSLEPAGDKTYLILAVTINLGGLRQFTRPVKTWAMKRDASLRLQNIKMALEQSTSTQ